MSLIILSLENWHAAKATLHQSLPQVRSSHLAEAMAAGLGARTHAALVKLCRPNAERPSICRGTDEAFVGRLGELGYPEIAPHTFDRAFAPDRLPHAPYVVYKSGDRAANNHHFHFCERLGRPMMMVKMARRYAELEWDCITVDPAEEDHLHDKSGDQLVRIMFNLFQARAKGAPGQPLFHGSAFTGTIEKLLPATARQLAEDYFQLLYTPLLTAKDRMAKAV